MYTRNKCTLNLGKKDTDISWYFKNFLITALTRTLTFLISLGHIVKPAGIHVFLRPIQAVGRFLFKHILVNAYRFYFVLKSKNNGYDNTRSASPIPTIINNRQTIHVGIFIMALVTMLFNITETNAESYVESTLLNRLITQDFPQEELIIENSESIAIDTDNRKPVKYTTKGYLAVLPHIGENLSEVDILEKQNIAFTRNGSAVSKQEIATTAVDGSDRNSAITYTVESGDTVTSIAKKFDISINTILWENDLSAYSIIKPGNKLTILSQTGLNHTVVKNETIASISSLYQVEPDAILEANLLLDGDNIKTSQVLFIPEGLKPKPKITPSPTHPSPTPTNTFTDAPKGGDFIWPTNSYRITQYYNVRHFGIDIGNQNGQPIYASASGIVEISSQGKWNGGYGNQMVINHENGFKTRYGHNSYNLVEAGDSVTQGQLIGAIGSTGRSTGPHIHFEIEYQGYRVNPFNYLSR